MRTAQLDLFDAQLDLFDESSPQDAAPIRMVAVRSYLRTVKGDAPTAKPAPTGSPRSRRGTTRQPNANSAAAAEAQGVSREVERLRAGNIGPAHRYVMVAAGWGGATDDEITERLFSEGFSRNTARPRRVALERSGLVEYAGDRLGAALWRLTDAGKRILEAGK